MTFFRMFISRKRKFAGEVFTIYRVLFADNEKMALIASERSFPLSEYHMLTAASINDSFEALHQLETRFFDIAFLDIRMPGLSGLEIIGKCIQQPIHPAFIVISGYSDFVYMKQAIQLGAFDYCLKPIQKDEAVTLLSRLEPYIYQSRLKNGPDLLAQLSGPDTLSKALSYFGFSDDDRSFTVMAVSAPSCRDLLFLPEEQFFSIFLEEQKAVILSTASPSVIEQTTHQLIAAGCHLAIGNFDRETGRFGRLIQKLQTDLLLTTDANPVIQTVAATSNDAFQKLLEEVRQEYTNDLSLQELAQKYNLSYSYCSELFKTVTGFTFSKYLTQLRMQAAAGRLLATDEPITDISYQVGYHNYHQFSVMFKSYFGLTPTEYRHKGESSGDETV